MYTDHQYVLGTVIGHHDDGNSYRIRLDNGQGTEVFAPTDKDEFVRKRKAPLRFKIGEEVEARMGEGYRRGKVLKVWEGGNAYRIRLNKEDGVASSSTSTSSSTSSSTSTNPNDDNQDVYAPEDKDNFVRKPPPFKARFAVGDRVWARVEVHREELAVVARVWDSGRAYRLKLESDGREVWAKKDEDGYVRRLIGDGEGEVGGGDFLPMERFSDGEEEEEKAELERMRLEKLQQQQQQHYSIELA